MASRAGGYVAWIVVGLLVGVGSITASSTVGALALLVGVGAAFAVWRWFRDTGLWLGIALSGAIPAPVLVWGAYHHSGCPSGGGLFPLKADKPRVDCQQVVASYLSMAVFFAIVAIIGLALPYVRRKAAAAREAADAEDALQAEGDAQRNGFHRDA